MLRQVGAKSAGHVHTCSGRIAIAELGKKQWIGKWDIEHSFE